MGKDGLSRTSRGCACRIAWMPKHRRKAPCGQARREVGEVLGTLAERMGGVLLGLFARCYLGAPYVDHRLTIVGRILEHYSAGDEVPAPFDGARGLARSSVYSYIEIYSDGEVVPIAADGTPA